MIWETGDRPNLVHLPVGDGRWFDGSRRWEIISYPTWQIEDKVKNRWEMEYGPRCLQKHLFHAITQPCSVSFPYLYILLVSLLNIPRGQSGSLPVWKGWRICGRSSAHRPKYVRTRAHKCKYPRTENALACVARVRNNPILSRVV